MKKLLYLIVVIFFSFPSYAQSIKVRKLKTLPVKHEAWFPSFGTNSREVLLTGKNYNGLSLYNTRTRKETMISDEPGAGYNLVLTNNEEIVYRVTTGTRGQRKTIYKSYNLDSKSHAELKNSAAKDLEVQVNGKQIELTASGEETKILQPVEGRYYVWASLSPDKRKILFTAVGKGSYVTDLEGNIIYELGYLNAPDWINNQWVVGMDDKDDGEMVISSEILAVHIASGKRKSISEGCTCMYPKASTNGDRIVYHSQKGEIIVAKIRIR